MTNYADYDQELAEEFERRLATRFRIEKLHYHVQRADKRNWAYINFLQVGNNIVLPAINTEEDEQAMEQIKHTIHHVLSTSWIVKRSLNKAEPWIV